MPGLVPTYGKYKYLPIYIKVCCMYFGTGFCPRWRCGGESRRTPVPLSWGGDALTSVAQSRTAAGRPRPAPRLPPGCSPRGGMGVKMGNGRAEKSGGLGWRRGDHLPITVAGETGFKMNSICCPLLALPRMGEHPGALTAVASLLPDHVHLSASAS